MLDLLDIHQAEFTITYYSLNLTVINSVFQHPVALSVVKLMLYTVRRNATFVIFPSFHYMFRLHSAIFRCLCPKTFTLHFLVFRVASKINDPGWPSSARINMKLLEYNMSPVLGGLSLSDDKKYKRRLCSCRLCGAALSRT
jgi:hypothetical protein